MSWKLLVDFYNMVKTVHSPAVLGPNSVVRESYRIFETILQAR